MAKTRTVIVTLELQTDIPLNWLNRQDMWQRVSDDHKLRAQERAAAKGQELIGGICIVRQVTATVAQPPKPGKGSKR